MASLDQAALLQKLQALSIAHENHEHEAVMTCEAQAAALPGADIVLTKNLFLKDKKGRLYVVTAAVDTKVDLKLLSARLGCGKSGVRMAADELIGSVLQVPKGSVTPLAVAQPGAAGVVLLLDAQLRGQQRIGVHPLDNRATTVLSSDGLEAFLRSLGREPAWVDLEASPKIDRDNPPDLQQLAETGAVLAADEKGPAAVAKGETMPTLHAKKDLNAQAAAVASGAAAAAAAAAKPAAAAKAAAPAAAKPAAAKAAAAARQPKPDDVLRVTDELVAQISAAVLGSAEAAAAVDADVLRRLKADVAMQLNALRNTSYSSGFASAKSSIAAAVSGQFA